MKSVWKKKWHYYKNPIFYGFILFSAYGIIRSLFSDIPFESLTIEGSVFFFRYIFFALGVWYLLDNNPYISKCFIVISITCIIIVCFDGLFQYFVGINLFGNVQKESSRLTGLFGQEPIIGRYIALLSLFTFALIYQNFIKTKKMVLLLITFLVMCEVIIFLTGERAPLFYVTFFAILIVIFVPHYKFYRVIGAIISAIIIFGIIQINPSAKVRMVDQTIKQVSQTTIPYLPYSPHHEEHYVASLKMFIDKPIFGVGTNTFRIKCKDPKYIYGLESCSSHPHHYYLQSLAELGIIGFMFLSSFFLYLLFIGLKQFFYLVLPNREKQKSFEFLLFPMILFIYWWPLIPHMSLYNNWNNVLIMLPLGYFMRYLYGNSKNGSF